MCAEAARDMTHTRRSGMQHNRKSGMPRDMFEAQNAPQTSKIKRGTEPYFDPISHNASFGTFGLQKYTFIFPILTMDSKSTLSSFLI